MISTLVSLSHIRDDVSSKQADKKTDFTVDLKWWGSLRLAPNIILKFTAGVFHVFSSSISLMLRLSSASDINSWRKLESFSSPSTSKAKPWPTKNRIVMMTCNKYCWSPFFSSECWGGNISVLVFKDYIACVWKSKDLYLVNCLVVSFQLQNPLTTWLFSSVPVSCTFSFLNSLSTTEANTRSCILVMYPTKMIASRRLKTSVNPFHAFKGMWWKVTSNQMTQCQGGL